MLGARRHSDDSLVGLMLELHALVQSQKVVRTAGNEGNMSRPVPECGIVGSRKGSTRLCMFWRCGHGHQILQEAGEIARVEKENNRGVLAEEKADGVRAHALYARGLGLILITTWFPEHYWERHSHPLLQAWCWERLLSIARRDPKTLERKARKKGTSTMGFHSEE